VIEDQLESLNKLDQAMKELEQAMLKSVSSKPEGYQSAKTDAIKMKQSQKALYSDFLTMKTVQNCQSPNYQKKTQKSRTLKVFCSLTTTLTKALKNT
jgi:hypothetical protein